MFEVDWFIKKGLDIENNQEHRTELLVKLVIPTVICIRVCTTFLRKY